MPTIFEIFAFKFGFFSNDHLPIHVHVTKDDAKRLMAMEFEPKDPVKTIQMVWFSDNRIFIKTEDDGEYSQPLEVFPALMFATTEQRSKFKINKWRDSIHWPEVDEDIHVSSFFENETVNYDNEVNELLSRFPWLDLKAFAEYIGMHWTKLARFRFGVWTPGPESFAQIKNGVKAIGKEMSAAVL